MKLYVTVYFDGKLYTNEYDYDVPGMVEANDLADELDAAGLGYRLYTA